MTIKLYRRAKNRLFIKEMQNTTPNKNRKAWEVLNDLTVVSFVMKLYVLITKVFHLIRIMKLMDKSLTQTGVLNLPKILNFN